MASRRAADLFYDRNLSKLIGLAVRGLLPDGTAKIDTITTEIDAIPIGMKLEEYMPLTRVIDSPLGSVMPESARFVMSQAAEVLAQMIGYRNVEEMLA